MKLGINYELSNEDYHASTEFYSSSMLKLILDSPEKYYHKYIAKDAKKETSDAFDTGTAIHARILEPHVYEKTVIFYDGMRRGKIWEAFKQAHEGKIILGNMQKVQLDTMYNAFMKSDLGPKLISGGASEVSLFTNLHGQPVKVRADYLNPNKTQIFDLKSTSGVITEESFKRMVEGKYGGYDLQAALYVDAYTEATKVAIGPSELTLDFEFYWIVMSKDFDDIKFFKASKSMIEQGRRKYKKALKLIEHYNTHGWTFSNDVIELHATGSNENEFDFFKI